MKTLLICETRQGKLLESTYELLAFAERLAAEPVAFLSAGEALAPDFDGRVYLAEAGEYDPDLHKQLILEVVAREKPDYIVLAHSSYGWDLAPRLAAALRVAQLSEVVDVVAGGFELPCFNAKLRRTVKPTSSPAVLTIQAGAFNPKGSPQGTPRLERLALPVPAGRTHFAGYEAVGKKAVDLARAEVIVSVGRGVGKQDNVALIEALARALGGELGATRPVVDAGWVEHSHQVGTTGQVVAPRLYVACGISGAIHHLAGMKKSDFVVAINKDRDAPIGEVADVLVVADVLQFVPALTARIAR
ncbi:MAG: electron transfer flavoprotein subunit alpha/FixB family protein [Anaerolineales bacterium]|nr:electron transfer flavoprotein subunit alpha/FixB family protein [Anaerolineales bacterium]